jgi:hypothetical protein
LEYSKMHWFRRGSLAVVLIHVLSFQAQSQGAEDESTVKNPVDLNEGVSFEISPHTGMMGGSGTFGLRLGMNYSSLMLELAGEQVIGKTANLYPLSVNAILNLATRGRLIPYGAVGGGSCSPCRQIPSAMRLFPRWV